jgi:pyridoxamine 5'-phosphate oxidase family protein
MRLTDEERAYLSTLRLGRLATVGPDGAPQNNPVQWFPECAVGYRPV